jgi:hypothetical protein
MTGTAISSTVLPRHGRWFGVVVEAMPRTGEPSRGEVIPWRVIAAQLAPRDRS